MTLWLVCYNNGFACNHINDLSLVLVPCNQVTCYMILREEMVLANIFSFLMNFYDGLINKVNLWPLLFVWINVYENRFKSNNFPIFFNFESIFKFGFFVFFLSSYGIQQLKSLPFIISWRCHTQGKKSFNIYYMAFM